MASTSRKYKIRRMTEYLFGNNCYIYLTEDRGTWYWGDETKAALFNGAETIEIMDKLTINAEVLVVNP